MSPPWCPVPEIAGILSRSKWAVGKARGGSISESIRDRRATRPPAHFHRNLRAGASWLFFRVARSTRMTQIWVLRSRLEKQPTDLRQYTCYFGDRTLACKGQRFRPVSYLCPAHKGDLTAVSLLLTRIELG